MNNPDVIENRKAEMRPLQQVVLWPGWLALGFWIALAVLGKMIDGKEIPWITYASQCWGATVFVLGVNYWRAWPENVALTDPAAKPKETL